MSGITPRYWDRLRVEPAGVPGRWRYVEQFRFDSAVIGARIIIDPGFITDFESVPRPLTLAYALLYGYANAEAGLHDWAYRMKLWSRALADRLFLEAMETDGTAFDIPRVAAWRRRAFYAGVRLGGWAAW